MEAQAQLALLAKPFVCLSHVDAAGLVVHQLATGTLVKCNEMGPHCVATTSWPTFQDLSRAGCPVDWMERKTEQKLITQQPHADELCRNRVNEPSILWLKNHLTSL